MKNTKSSEKLPVVFRALLIIAVLAVSSLCMVPVAADDNITQPAYAPDRVIVKYQDPSNSGTNIASILSASTPSAKTPAEILADFSDFIPGLQVVQLPDGVTVEDAITYYILIPGVVYVEPDYSYSVSAVPTDPEYTAVWGLHNFSANGGASAEPAWDITTGNDSVIVAVIDSGVDIEHPDLAANIWTNPGEIAGDNIDNDGNGFTDDVHGWSFFRHSSNVTDFNGHGTHCSGTVGAVANNGYGVAGTAWNVSIMPVQVMAPTGSGYQTDIIAGMLYAIDNGADILSMSLGGNGEKSQAYQDAVDYAESHGVLIVAAAGNENSDNDALPSWPASFENDNVIAVAASDSDNTRASFSNYGATSVDLAAPGVNIYSTYPNVTSDETYLDGDMLSLFEYYGYAGVLDSGWSETTIGSTTIYQCQGTNSSVLYESVPIQAEGEFFKVTWRAAYSLPNTNYLRVLISTKDFSEYSDISDMLTDVNSKWMLIGGNQETDSGGYIYTENWQELWSDIEDKIGSGPYYIGLWYYGTGSSNQAILVSLQIDNNYHLDTAYPHKYSYSDGTSMATPMVAGAAALIKSMNQSLTPAEIKAYLLDNVDVISGFSDMWVTGGRLNITKAVMAARPQFTVTFNSTGGTAVSSQQIYYNDKVTRPSFDPTWNDYIFSGWYKDSALTTLWNFTEDVITASTMIYAGWIPDQTSYIGALSLNLTNCEITDAGVNYTAYIEFTPVTDFKLNGFRFAIASNDSHVSFTNSSKIDQLIPGFDNFSCTTFVSSYGSNGNSYVTFGYIDTSRYVDPNVTIVSNIMLPGNVTSKIGEFIIKVDSTIISKSVNISFVQDYFPNSTENQCYVTAEDVSSGYYLNDSLLGMSYVLSNLTTNTFAILNLTVDNVSFAKRVEICNKTNLSAVSPLPTKPGYSFNGWNVSDNPSVLLINSTGHLVPGIAGYTSQTGAWINSTLPNGAELTLIANWIYAPSYPITYHLNGGANSPLNPSTYKYSSSDILFENPIKSGSIFAGWYNESSFVNPVPCIPANSSGAVDLYAKWDVYTAPNETVNTSLTWSAVISADFKYSLAGVDNSSIEVPLITNKKSKKSLRLNDTIVIKRQVNHEMVTLDSSNYSVDSNNHIVINTSAGVQVSDLLEIEFVGSPWGDADGDRAVTVNDAVRIAQSLVHLVSLKEKDAFYGDTDGDGSTTVNDAVKVAQRLVNLVDENYDPY